MKIMIDKVFIKCLNEQYGLDLTYSSFKKFYIDVVKSTRDVTPSVIKRRKLNDMVNTVSDGYFEDIVKVK